MWKKKATTNFKLKNTCHFFAFFKLTTIMIMIMIIKMIVIILIVILEMIMIMITLIVIITIILLSFFLVVLVVRNVFSHIGLAFPLLFRNALYSLSLDGKTLGRC